jgi:TPR repeat protein
VTRTLSLAVTLAALMACQRGPAIPESLANEIAACDAGDMTSCENAAGAFENGTGVPPNPERTTALRKQLLSLAQSHCDKGQAHGCSYLGRLYLEGIGVAPDRRRGLALLRRGCAGRDPLACTYLENLGISGSPAGLGPRPAAPAPDLFKEIERRSSEAERRLSEDLRKRPQQ